MVEARTAAVVDDLHRILLLHLVNKTVQIGRQVLFQAQALQFRLGRQPVIGRQMLVAFDLEPEQGQTQIKVIRPEVPASLRTCESAPAYPGDSITQKDMAKWITRLWYAHADCESKLASLNQALGYGDEHTESKR